MVKLVEVTVMRAALRRGVPSKESLLHLDANFASGRVVFQQPGGIPPTNCRKILSGMALYRVAL
jgi:hypothetical protein